MYYSYPTVSITGSNTARNVITNYRSPAARVSYEGVYRN